MRRLILISLCGLWALPAFAQPAAPESPSADKEAPAPAGAVEEKTAPAAPATAEEPGAQDTATGTPAEGAPAERAPAEGAPAERAPAEEAPAKAPAVEVVKPIENLQMVKAPAMPAGPAPSFQLKLPSSVVLTPHFQYRARFLFRDNRDGTDTAISDSVRHRARVGLDVQIKKWWRVMVQLQDVRTWGEEGDTLGDYTADGIDFHQAFAEVSLPTGLFLRIGRQEVSLDNQRLIGAVNWADQARSFDGIRFGYENGAFMAHAFWAQISEDDVPGGVDGDAPPARELTAIWVRYTGFSYARPSLLFAFDKDSGLERNRITAGIFVDGTVVKGLRYSAEFYYQGGKIGPDSASSTISAMLAAGRVAYTAPVWGKPTVEAFFDYLSGDDNGSDAKVQAFDTLFATNHKFYGFMDYFTNIPLHTGGLGLIDAGGRLKLAPKKGLLVFADFHRFTTATDNKAIGHEIDIVARIEFNRFASLEAVFGAFLPDQGETGTFGYLATNLAL